MKDPGMKTTQLSRDPSQALLPTKDSNAASPAKPVKKKSRTKENKGPGDTVIWDLHGAGDCGYRSIAAAIAICSGKTKQEVEQNIDKMATTVKARGISWLKENKQWRETWTLDPEATMLTEGGSIPTTADEYLEALSRPARWIDGLIAQAIATAVKNGIIIWERKNNQKWKMVVRVSADESVLRDPIVLLLEDDHYCTADPTTPGSDQWKKAQPKGQFPRGSGKSACSWMKPGSMVSKGSTRKTPKSKNKRKSDEKSVASWCQAGEILPKSICKKKAQEPMVWTCPHCQMVLEDSTPHKLNEKRNRHITNRHFGMRGKSTWRRKTVDVVIVTKSLPKDQVAWICPFCRDTLPELSKWQKFKSVRHHYDTKHKKRKMNRKSILVARGKLYRKDEDCHPSIKEGQIALRQRNFLNADKRAKANDVKNGHNAVWIKPDWSKWAGKASSKNQRPDLQFAPNVGVGPPGKPYSPFFFSRTWWRKMRGEDNPNVELFLKAWNTKLEVADKHFVYVFTS